MGKWESKKTKLYVCEKDGKQKLFSATALKEVEGWEKLFNYKMSSGKKEWHTKSYAEEHKGECIELVNRYFHISELDIRWDIIKPSCVLNYSHINLLIFRGDLYV